MLDTITINNGFSLNAEAYEYIRQQTENAILVQTNSSYELSSIGIKHAFERKNPDFLISRAKVKTTSFSDLIYEIEIPEDCYLLYNDFSNELNEKGHKQYTKRIIKAKHIKFRYPILYCDWFNLPDVFNSENQPIRFNALVGTITNFEKKMELEKIYCEQNNQYSTQML